MKLIKNFLNFLKIQKINVGASAIIKNSKGEILLGKRSKDMPFYPNTWNLPGGLLDYKEKLEQSVIREVKEELGINVKIIKKSDKVYEVFPTRACSFHTINFVYYCEIIEGNPKSLDETTQVKWFKPSEIKKMKLAYIHKKILKKEKII
jgi:mutator protein MutT